MAYSAPTTRSTGFFVNAAVWNQDIVDNITFLANPPSVKVYNSGNQSIPDNVDTALTWTNELWDTTGSMWAASPNPTRLVIPVAGLYLVTGSCALASAADYNHGYIYALLNGTTQLPLASYQHNAGSGRFNLNYVAHHKFAVSDYIELYVNQDNAANAARNSEAPGSYRAPTFAATWVGFG
jgi:hypothetical protein